MAACAAPACRIMAAAARAKNISRAIFIGSSRMRLHSLLHCRTLAAPGKARLWQVGRFECNGLHLPQPEGPKTLLRPPPLAHSATAGSVGSPQIANREHGTIRPERKSSKTAYLLGKVARPIGRF